MVMSVPFRLAMSAISFGEFSRSATWSFGCLCFLITELPIFMDVVKHVHLLSFIPFLFSPVGYVWPIIIHKHVSLISREELRA